MLSQSKWLAAVIISGAISVSLHTMGMTNDASEQSLKGVIQVPESQVSKKRVIRAAVTTIPDWLGPLLRDLRENASRDRIQKADRLLSKTASFDQRAWDEVHLVVAIEAVAKACIIVDRRSPNHPDVSKACSDGFVLLRKGGDPETFHANEAFALKAADAAMEQAENQVGMAQYSGAVIAYRGALAVAAAMRPSNTSLGEAWRHAAAVAGAEAVLYAPSTKDPSRFEEFGKVGERVAYDEAADVLNNALAGLIAERVPS